MKFGLQITGYYFFEETIHSLFYQIDPENYLLAKFPVCCGIIAGGIPANGINRVLRFA
jgi:hypothetical protein